MVTRSDDVRHVMGESLAPFNRNQRRLPRKQRQHDSHETKQVCTGIEEDYLGNSVSMNLPDVRHMTDESLAPFHRNRGRLPRKPRQHESSSKGQSTAGQEESAVVFWWNRPSNLFTQHIHSKWK
ncbi:unnamed protein product [Protopolystoma xenopodis]|uniref:Uncharacterized protein n=1 Tax=Protopolystoma xenopodis TaxID=117903 RepID=A0A3S5BFL3_9PLAT|nr:unnamed protein product [Protopolystoma xenopodis]